MTAFIYLTWNAYQTEKASTPGKKIQRPGFA